MSTRRSQRGAPPAKPASEPSSPLIYVSDRSATLRFAALVCAVPVPLTIWLLSLGPRGAVVAAAAPAPSWLLPVLLVALSAVLPGAMCFLHGRYVLRMERTQDGGARMTTWLLWGQRTEEWPLAELRGTSVLAHQGRFESRRTVSVNAPYLMARLPSGKRLILDQQGDAPHGWDAVYGVFRLQRP